MSKKFTKLLAVVLVAAMALAVLVACVQGGPCTVTYKANYEGSGKDRTMVVANGATAVDYQATRGGYDLVGWFTDQALTQQFDFETAITQNVTLYAKWQRQPQKLQVTFDTMLEGEQPVVVSVMENEAISQDLVPACMRLGYEYRSWYKDEALTTAWDFELDKVTENVTLYAEYMPDLSLDRDVNNNIVFNNVTVNLFAEGGSGVIGTLDSNLKPLIEQFNNEYRGKINVSLYSGGLTEGNQNTYALRYQQVSGTNEDIVKNYYKASSVYDLAGIEWNEDDWYANATRNCYANGSLYTIPVVAGVPYIIYNKSLMTKYNGNAALPSNYAEFSALLKKVYEGEVTRDPNFKTIVTSTNWIFREATSMAPYIQNDADYYVYENGKHVNKWGEVGSQSYNKAISALTNVYNLFGAGGECHGGTTNDTWLDNLARNAVSGSMGLNPSAFMAIINMPYTEVWKYCATKRTDGSDYLIAAMPLSGLFASEGSEQAAQIPVHTLGFQFYKAKNVSTVELAAAAVFADWVSKNTHGYAQQGWYPLNKTVTSADAFAKPYGDNYNNNQVIYWILRNSGNPENFRTLDGYAYEKQIINTLSGEQYMVTGGVLAAPTGSVNQNYIADQIRGLKQAMSYLLD